MEIVRLDGAALREREQAIDALGRALSLPEWWGRNLDALHDCLTDLGRPVRLELYGRDELESTAFGRRLLRVLQDSAAQSIWLELTADPGKERPTC